tara:strand:- start:935 stop:2548 length:1614 start_codon:yes stop_codon:yes gene_type:complete
MSLVEAAEAVRQKGRYGDSVLMHVNPQEAQALAAGSGGYLTTNPDTGLPEAFLPALLPILGGLGGTALATSGALAGAGGLGAFFAANPYMAGALGTALGKTVETGDLGAGLKAGAVAGLTGGLMQGLTGGEFIRSGSDIGASGMEAAVAGDTATALENISPAVDPSTIDIASLPTPEVAAASAAGGGDPASVLAQRYTDANRQALLADMGEAGITTRLPESANVLGTGEYASTTGKDLGFMDKIFEPSRPAYVDPTTGEFVKGQINPMGQVVSGIGGAILEEAAFPEAYDFPEKEKSAPTPERFGVRDRFQPDADYRGGVDPEFRYFSPTRFIADGGAVRMQMGGLAALEEMQGMDPTASGLGAMAGVMEGADPDSSMMQIQEMMMEAPSPDGQMQDIVVVEAVSAIRGEHANPELAIQAFVEQYGQDALNVLVEQVNQEMMLEQMGQNQDMLVEGDGMIDGIGKGRDDMVQATLEGEKDVLLSDGEFVLPADVVSGIGDGSSKAGEDELMKLIDRVRTRRTGTKEPPNMVGEVMPA